MKTLKISLDFLAGPLWKDEFIDGELKTGIPAIDNDNTLQSLNDQICELYSSCYEFDSHDQACWFNEEKEKADKPRMLELLGKLNARIAELDDGTFVVDDQETPRVEALQSKPEKSIKLHALADVELFARMPLKAELKNDRFNGFLLVGHTEAIEGF